jgi:hypothetical protein
MRTHHSFSPSLRSLAAAAALLACCASSLACSVRLYLRDGARPRLEIRLLSPGDRKGPREYFVRLEGQREGGRTIAIAPFFVYPGPFSFQGVGGISDPDRIGASSDAIACFELFEDGFFGDTDRSVAFCGRYVQGGYQVFSSENQDQRFYPAVYQLEFRVEHDGANVSYYTRPIGAPSWDLVTSVPLSYETRLIPSMGGLGFHKGGVYDVEGLTWTTTAPVDPTPEESFGWHVMEAYRFDLAALENLEGAAPDFAAATNDLGLARSQLSLALAETPDFLDAKIGKQVARYTIRGDRRLEKAQREAGDGDVNGAVKQLLRAFRDQGTAFQGAYRLDFRGQF